MFTRSELEERYTNIKELLFQTQNLSAEAIMQLMTLQDDVRKDLDYLHKRNMELIVQLYPVDEDDEEDLVDEGDEAV
jgi:hypothetical protein